MIVKFVSMKGSDRVARSPFYVALANALGVETRCVVDFSDLQHVKAHTAELLPGGRFGVRT